MPHKIIKKSDIEKVKDEMGRLAKAIDRLRIYSNAKDNETIKTVLSEIKIVCASTIRRKNDALNNFSEQGDREARFWLGYEKGLEYLIDTFDDPESQIKEYSERRKQLESHLAKLRTTHEIR